MFSKKFLWFFLVSLFIFEFFLLADFFSRYWEDITGKGLSLSILGKLVGLTFLSFLGFSLLFAILIASILAFRNRSRLPGFSFKKSLIRNLPIFAVCSVLLFCYNNWLLPKFKLEMTAMIYDITNTVPGQKLVQTDRTLFSSSYRMVSIASINLQKDSLNAQITDYLNQVQQKLDALPDSIVHIKYNELGLVNYGLKINRTKPDSINKNNLLHDDRYVDSYMSTIKELEKKKQKMVLEEIVRILIPIHLFLLFVIGASFGYYYNDQKKFLLVILGLFTARFFNGALFGSEKLGQSNIYNGITGAAIFLVILMIVTVIFLFQSLEKEKRIKLEEK